MIKVLLSAAVARLNIKYQHRQISVAATLQNLNLQICESCAKIVGCHLCLSLLRSCLKIDLMFRGAWAHCHLWPAGG